MQPVFFRPRWFRPTLGAGSSGQPVHIVFIPAPAVDGDYNGIYTGFKITFYVANSSPLVWFDKPMSGMFFIKSCCISWQMLVNKMHTDND